MKLLTRSLLCFSLILSPLFASEYEVTINGKTYAFEEGKEQGILLKDGQRIQVSVKGGKFKTYKNETISFQYLKDTKLTEKIAGPTKVITLTSSDFAYLMIQIFPPETKPNELRQTYLDTYKKSFTKRGIKLAKAPEPCVRTIAGIEQKGMELTMALAGLEQKVEFYAIEKKNKTIGMIFQHAVKFKKTSLERFDVITKSLK